MVKLVKPELVSKTIRSDRSIEWFPERGFKIVLKDIEQPFSHSIEQELDWICSSLGFFEPIDRDKTASKIFKEIIHSTESNKPLSSAQLAQRVRMSRGSVMNHLNNLLRAGLIVKRGRVYLSRSPSVFRTIEEIESDMERILERMKKTAREIDKSFGMHWEQ